MSTKSKKILRYSLYGLGGTLLFVVLAALILPYLFKDKILATAKHYINQQLNATVEIEDVDLSLLWTFPEFSFKLKGLSVTGKEEFEGLKLAEMKHFGLYLNLWSVISGDYTVTGVELQEPKLYIKVLNNGKANYDIVKPSTDTTSTAETPAEEGAGDFRVKLRYYALNEADVVYDDAPAGLFLQIKNLSHKGSADFTASNFDLFTRTTIEALSFKQGGIPYLSKAELEAKLDVQADMQAMRFKLLDNNFRINDVRLALEGEVAMPGEDIDMDLKFSSPSTAFASVLSLVPGAYTKDFAGLKAGGSFAFSAFAKGIYNAKSLPAFGLNLQVKDGNFQYPSLPMGVKDVQMDLQVNSPSSNLDAMAIDLKQFKMLLGANAFEANMALRTPLSDPDVRAELKGKIDLADLAKAFPMEEVQELNGLIETDLSAKTKLSYVEQELYDQVQMRGLFRLTGFNYLSKGLPKVSIKEFKTEFTPNFVQVDNFDLTVGKSDFQIQGKLDNILTYFSRDKVMEGFLQVESKLLDANELMAASGSGESSSAQPTAVDMVDTSQAASAEVEVFDRFRFAANIKMNKVLYDTYDVRDIVAEGSFTPEMAKLQKLSLLIGKTDMLAEGQLENVFAYLFGKGVLRGYLNFSSNYFNLNQLMGESGQATEPAPQPAPADPSTASSAIEAFEVPANLDLAFNANIKRLIYETYKLDNARAEVLVKDQKVKIVDLRCDALGGFIALNGEYDAKDLSKPKFSFGYDIQKIDFQEAHKSVALVQYFLPVMKSIQGRFDSKFKIQGLLDKNLYPVLSSITAEGAIITSEAILKGFSALTNLSKEVGVKDLDELTLKGTKNFFSIKDGRVELQPFVYEFKGIDLNFGGSHGLDNTSDYKLKMRVPKASLTANPVGAAAGAAAQTGLNKLQGQASKLGVNLTTPEVQFVNLGVDITGSLLKPQFKVNFLGAETKDGQGVGDQVGASLREEADKLKAEAEAKAREMEEKARAEADKLKAEAEAKARAEADKLRSEGEKAKAEAEAKARAEAERLRKEAEAKAKAEADRLRQSQAAQAAQAARDSAARAAQQRLKLPKNPLKKDK